MELGIKRGIKEEAQMFGTINGIPCAVLFCSTEGCYNEGSYKVRQCDADKCYRIVCSDCAKGTGLCIQCQEKKA